MAKEVYYDDIKNMPVVTWIRLENSTCEKCGRRIYQMKINGTLTEKYYCTGCKKHKIILSQN